MRCLVQPHKVWKVPELAALTETRPVTCRYSSVRSVPARDDGEGKTMSRTMRALSITGITPAGQARLTEVPIPTAKPGWVLVRVRGIGMNHSEWELRHDEIRESYITHPIIPGIEGVGEVVDPSDQPFVKEFGANEVVLDDGKLADAGVRADKVLELIGPKTLRDSLGCLNHGGICCDTGILGGEFTLDAFDPIKDIPNGCYLTGSSPTTPRSR